jgi:hypothetical protein
MAVQPRADLVDGIEVYNVWNQPGEDKQALALSRQKPFILTSGGDIHVASDAKIGMAGIALPYRVRDEKEFVAALKRGDQQYIINSRIVPEVLPEYLP